MTGRAPRTADEALDALGRISREREENLIGSCLVDEQAFLEARETLAEADFWDTRCATVWDQMSAVAAKGMAPTFANVVTAMRRAGSLAAIGGVSELAGWCEGVNLAGDRTSDAIQMVTECSDLRRVVEASSAAIAAAAADSDPSAVLARAEAAFFEIGARRRSRGGGRSIADLSRDALSAILDEGKPGISTGFADIDAMVGGLRPGRLFIIAARPSMGKTSLAVQIATSAALAGHHTLFFTLEVPAEGLAEIIIRSRAGVASDAAAKDISTDLAEKLYAEAQTLSGLPLEIEDPAAVTIGRLIATSRLVAARNGTKVILVDYLQLVSSDKQTDNRAADLARVSGGLKQIARALDCSVIALAQLNRSCEARKDKRPILSDLRESGSIEQDADVIGFVYRDEYYNPGLLRAKGRAELIIAKNRNGPIGTVNLGWHGPTQRFVSEKSFELSRLDQASLAPPRVPDW